MPPLGYSKEASLTNFLKKVDTTGDCWLWTAKALRGGFPALSEEVWGTAYARQWIYHYNGGELKSDTTLYSTCGNKLCCNPDHLTYTDPVPLLTQFMDKVNTHGPVAKESLGKCWIWNGACGPGFGDYDKGHGYLRREKWGETLAHRWIYHKTYPNADISCNTINHRCDVPFCVNPAHLELGTQNSNVGDRSAQGRGHNQRFKPEDILPIRKRIMEGARTKDLCEEFKCSKVCIADLKKGRSWNEDKYYPPGYPRSDII